ncbi:hypothetical protein CYMTET_55557 [Cymbomonas tetramitiformis]|uniref:Uncharacterized protein n=1 Tax=Cymbomonas tetramitiformis TaxID=36881 RepID=A0AAE0BDW4_9CHLO|nr:hypothetical protein CYMTET_55557 [Cymbomonas tetramitiformis]
MKKAALGVRGGLNGYRTGAAKDGRPPVGFDKAEMRALPRLQAVFQDAANCGPDAFAAAIEVHGSPAVLTAGGAAAELDMSACGFSVPAEGGAGYGTLAARLSRRPRSCPPRVCRSTVRPLSVALMCILPPAAAAITVGWGAV